MNTGDTAWMLASAALVLFMTPGLAAFYSGMVRKKNVLSTTMHSFFAMGLVSVIWALVGFTLAFGEGTGSLSAFIGDFSMTGLMNVNGELFGTIPLSVFAMYQGMFAIITVALITGAIAERMKFRAYVIFATLWAIFVYSPLAHWVWQTNGWLFRLGALDFAGGTVVHISSAAAALAAAIMLGKRRDLGTDQIHPHNLPMTVLGAGILWFGWFGFNAGSALAANGLAGSAFMNTHLAAAALLAWTLVETMHAGKPTVLGAASGAVAGLVGVTPAAGYVEPWAAIVIGLVVGVACYFGLFIKGKFGFDDALDVVGIHGVGGTLGALLTGVFATTTINEAGRNGLLYGNPSQIVLQLVGIVAAWAFSFVLSIIFLKVIDMVMGLRVSDEVESRGLDISEHAEEGYIFE
ncbi:MAG: ammonium transporter [Coriobacteriales bacterium]|nr:ammonium transporter [Coriobacteriales bacterium]